MTPTSIRLGIHRRLALFGGLLLAFLAGCSDSMSPPAAGGGAALFDGTLDPAASQFVLKRVTLPTPGYEPVVVELVGSNLRVDRLAERVSLEVAIRNPGDRTLLAPATLWVGCFRPGTVTVHNAELGRRYSGCLTHGFDYSRLLGGDDVLQPGETSRGKTWIFGDPGLVSFSFEVEAVFELQPLGPHISGTVFQDGNRNGTRDSFEGPLTFQDAGVSVRGPDGVVRPAPVRSDGGYRLRVERPGLYRVTCGPSRLDCCPICVTTQNPLEVVLVAGPEGTPQSYEGADFGVVPGTCDDPIPQVLLVDAPPELIPQDSYTLLDAKLEGDVLSLRVGFSGCAADHPFALYAGAAFMESIPVQTWVVLSHDGRGEVCRAYFERTLQFDLDPIRRNHLRLYHGPGEVRLRFRDFQGNERSFLFGP